MAAKLKPGQDAGSANIRSDIGATEDEARRRVAAASGAEGVSGQALINSVRRAAL